MLKGRGRATAGVASPAPGHLGVCSAGMTSQLNMRPGLARTGQGGAVQQRALPAKPEPDYEVVEFPSDQYVNAKLQPPPPPPPRPPTGHPAQAGASCGLCGGGGARVRCAECGRRALCASCDDMYHRHPKRRHHQRQALSLSQLGEDRPPLPPKGTPPVPPPRRHKLSASPMPTVQTIPDQRRATLGHAHAPIGMRASASPTMNQSHQPMLVQTKIVSNASQLGSIPFLPTTMPHQHAVPVHMQQNANTLGQMNARWSGPRGSLQGFNVPQVEPWENPQAIPPGQWGRPMRRGASTLELGGGAACAGCVQCATPTWRYGSCATLDQPWNGGWPVPQQCCPPQQAPHDHFHMHQHQPMTPQPYRRADNRGISRAVSRTGSRAASPALSVRSRASRRTKHRTPSPPLPSSDADSESESESEPAPKPQNSRGTRSNSRSEHPNSRPERPNSRTEQPSSRNERTSSRNERRNSGNERRNSGNERPSSRNERPGSRNEHQNSQSDVEDGLGPAPPPPAASWQCEHCTYVNEAGVRVCVICCRTPTAAPKVVDEVASNFERLKISLNRPASVSPEKVEPIRVEKVSERTNATIKKERTSTGCGPSPPRDDKTNKTTTQRLVTPIREQNGSSNERQHLRHDMAVGPSPPRESRPVNKNESPQREPTRASPYDIKKVETLQCHSISVGPSPPRDKIRQESNVTGQKKFVGTSPPRDVHPESHSFSISGKTNVSNTGTSPPPQSISTQTYEDPNTYERERAPSVARSRPRRRFRDDRRERSHSRHSLSSDTRESERSVRTTGAWEWRERDSSPVTGEEWGGKLARRASHLDLRRRDVRPRRTSLYGSEAPSPEPPSGGRAISMEVLSGVGRNAERGLELARLLAEAERLGYSAAEVQVGLAQSPSAPLTWLRSRWAGLVGAVQGAAARLAPGAPLSEPEARAALARHRGSVWPAVTECVDTLRRQTVSGGGGSVSSAGLVRGRVWGSPAGADDESAPRAREDSSDEYDAPPPEDDWYPPIDDGYDLNPSPDLWSEPAPLFPTDDVALKLRSLLLRAGIPAIDENLLLKGLLADAQTKLVPEPIALGKMDFIQSENDFIDAYNALTRASPLPNISKAPETEIINTESVAKEQYVKMKDETQRLSAKETNKLSHKSSHNHHKHKHHVQKHRAREDTVLGREENQEIRLPEIEPPNAIKQSQSSPLKNDTNVPDQIAQIIKHAISREIENLQMKEIETNPSNQISTPSQPAPKTSINQKNEEDIADPSNIQSIRYTDEKTSNLNEIVDNTQKLIQQMKEEINSDIHSLDDGHSQSSLSDHDTSSHDEQESSYSESEEETNHTTVTSDEKEITSSSSEEKLDDFNDNEALKSSSAFINRTSSEDNEQFEEALDNLDNQIEDVKHANIEMLDSIARSLQEEHTISVEKNEPKKYLNQDISTTINSPKESNLKREDSNNNLFIAVNSFEEIYEELNTSKVNKIPIPSASVIKTLKKSEPIDSITVPLKKTYTKLAINESIFQAVSPTKIVIEKNTEPTYNAVIENIEINVNNSPIETATEVIHDDIDEDNETTKIDSQQTFDSELVSDLNLSSSVEIKEAEVVTNSNINIDETKSESINIAIEQNSTLTTNDPKSNNAAQNSSENKSVKSIQNGFIKQGTPEKTMENLTIDTYSNKSSTATKSSIPKPIRQAPNNKPKNEKLTPKLLVSKVPVRRGSLKQNHAPAPPKSHFGNLQSGLVKQLQSKIFNSKPVKPQVAEIEVRPSTSTATLMKKGPAPQPPRNLDQGQSTPPKTSPPKEKRDNYFRETCRTEDEWTESDSDESQILKQTFNEEEQPSPPSPPPPITLRRVSGNIIDLARVQLPDGSPERQARMLLAEGATETWEQAHLAVELVSRGAELPAALLAALECADLPAALTYLHQDCELCASRLPEHEMVSMLRCTHRCCRECARLYFTVQITERSIADCVCPFCKMPELETLPEDAWLEYFSHLDIQLKMLLETDVHELFQRKLRDRTLAMDPNFRWCMECSSGFFVHPKHKKLRCPECRSVSCASCRKPWNSNHEGLSCEQYAAWLADNDPEISVAAVQQHLRENGLECPRCHFKYSLSRGGCMHFTCTQCKYEFCYGCGKPFTMGARCGLSEYCAKLGLHAHHPRNCLFYLRDKEPHELQTLLQMNNVTYEIDAAEGTNGRCPIPLQRETPAGLVDGICGSEAPPKHAGLCKNHYLEYLTRLVRAHKSDPLPILGVDDLETLVRRAGLRPPPRPYGSLEGLYRRALTEVLLFASRTHYVEYLAGLARGLDPIPIMDVPELVAELRRRALPLPERGPWDTDPIYAGMCAEIVREKIPLD